MLKLGLFAGLLVTAAPALAQGQQGGGMPPAIQQAAMAFGQCVETGVRGVAANVTPEAGATTVLAGCATQKTALENTVTSFITAAPMPAEQKEAALAQMRIELGKAETEIANAIRQSRAVPAAPAQ